MAFLPPPAFPISARPTRTVPAVRVTATAISVSRRRRTFEFVAATNPTPSSSSSPTSAPKTADVSSSTPEEPPSAVTPTPTASREEIIAGLLARNALRQATIVADSAAKREAWSASLAELAPPSPKPTPYTPPAPAYGAPVFDPSEVPTPVPTPISTSVSVGLLLSSVPIPANTLPIVIPPRPSPMSSLSKPSTADVSTKTETTPTAPTADSKGTVPVAPKPVAPKPVAPESVAPKPVAPTPVAPTPVAPKPIPPKPVPPTPQPRTPISTTPTASRDISTVADLYSPAVSTGSTEDVIEDNVEAVKRSFEVTEPKSEPESEQESQPESVVEDEEPGTKEGIDKRSIGEVLIDAIVKGVASPPEKEETAVDKSALIELVDTGKIKNLTVSKLRRLLTDNGLKTSGRKSELIARLTSFAKS